VFRHLNGEDVVGEFHNRFFYKPQKYKKGLSIVVL